MDAATAPDDVEYGDDEFLSDEPDASISNATTNKDDQAEAVEVSEQVAATAERNAIPATSPSKRQAAIDEHHRNTLAAKEVELRNLYKRISVYRKANAALQKELEGFHNNDFVAQVENKAREKQLLIEKLTHENKYLANLQRTQAKRIEELESLKEHFPSKHHSVMEELRICKETYRMCKERERLAEDRSAKLHQQVVDLMARNKALADKIRQHHSSTESKATTNDATARRGDGGGGGGGDDDDDDLAQLRTRVALLEKTKRAEKAKYERVIQMCQEQLDACKREMEAFQAQLLEKEKELRLQVVELKKLKRQLRDLAVDAQSTHQVCHTLAQRQPTHTKKTPMPPSGTSTADKRSPAPVRIQKPTAPDQVHPLEHANIK
ncbi:hypothetical protein H310_05036 [Aphanomyces invadans]|uniref:Lebercilin domain-containing protein n=1 Tax=Aphanomyces invadans TaxID=157072 RepID=A0A024UCL6_9STRA|nr:hypothetical protein H310_05036 [Aphanomyces invadans]ETW03637.1 hypothetical protein H310_05036 [Aphanomyces invadans]|eukprot:XP_008867866.1 hypothetical protein H310_05036 [Aphanomyces invadans]